jgi:acetyl esterase/lipase
VPFLGGLGSAVDYFPAQWKWPKMHTGAWEMPTFAELDWRTMSQEARDLGLNNGTAVAGSADMVAGWEQRSAEMRTRLSTHLDLRYGPRERNRIDFFKAAESAPTLLFIHGGYWQNRAKEVFSIFAEGPMAHGINVALIGYTLAPDATLDEIVAEIHAGIDFLAGQLPVLGAASDGIVVSGWSAGGHLTSMALSNAHVRAGMAISGIYDLEPIRHSYLNEKLKLDEAMSRRNSPMMVAGGAPKPFAGRRQRGIAAVAQADRRFCRPPRAIWFAGDV